MDNQLAIITNSMEVFKTAPAILLEHQETTSKALAVADSIQEQWTACMALTDRDEQMKALGEWDIRANKFLAKCSTRNADMKQARSAITQLMDMLREMYTKEENALDPKKGDKVIAIQQNRNAYAKLALEDAERQRKLAEAKAAKEKEEVEIRTFVSGTISQKLIDHLAERKLKLSESFNRITLENFIDKSLALRSVNPAFPLHLKNDIVKLMLPRFYRHADAEIIAILNAEQEAYDFDSFYKKHELEITEFKQSLVDRLPSKKAELEEAKRVADEAEAKRQDELNRQKIAEEARQERIRQSNAAEKERLEKQAEEDRKKEAQRLKEMEDNAELERQNQANIQREREEQERSKIAGQAENDRKKSEEESELKRTSGTAMAMFNEVNDLSSAAATPEVRAGIEITVVHVAGWVELFQFWFTKAGITMNPDEIESMTFKKLKAFAEKAAKDTPKKNGERIDSKNLVYSDTISSVNRKQKVNA